MYVAIRDSIVSWLGYKKVIECVKDLGLETFELEVKRNLNLGLEFDISTEKKRREIIKRLESENVRICAFLVANDFSREDVEAEIRWIIDACKAASSLNVDVVRIDSIHKKHVSMKECTRLIAKYIREIIAGIKDLDVSIGIENHGIIGNDKEFLREILDSVKSERVGLTLDTGNFYWYGYPLDEVYEIIELFAPYVKHTHIKNLSFSEKRRNVRREPGEGYPKTASPLYKGDIDLKWVVNTLKKVGYDRDLTIEDESIGNFPLEQRLDIIRKDVEYMKSLI